MGGRGVPFHHEVETALQMAKARIATYKGSKPVFDSDTRLLVHGIVLDSLIIAPQPVTPGWVHTSLMATGGLVKWALNAGEPLTREHLLSARTRARFVNLGLAHMTDQARRNYRCRLDLVTTALSGVPVIPTSTAPVAALEAVEPHTDADIAGLWLWVNGQRPATRRDRLVSSLILGLGLGLRASEIVTLKRDDITIDRAPSGAINGVDALVTDTRGGTRSVTCTATWEQRLAEWVDGVEPGHRVNTPWRREATTARMLQSSLAIAQHQTPPPVWFSARSLRNSWLVGHLTAGTPVPTLLDAAGIESIEALKAYLPWVPVLTGDRRADVLRAGTAPFTGDAHHEQAGESL
jgi:integrase